MLTNPRDAFRGLSRSSKMVGLPFDMLNVVSY